MGRWTQWRERACGPLQHRFGLQFKPPLKVFFNTLISPIRCGRKHEAIQYVFGDVFTGDRNLLILLIFIILLIELPIDALVSL